MKSLSSSSCECRRGSFEMSSFVSRWCHTFQHRLFRRQCLATGRLTESSPTAFCSICCWSWAICSSRFHVPLRARPSAAVSWASSSWDTLYGSVGDACCCFEERPRHELCVPLTPSHLFVLCFDKYRILRSHLHRRKLLRLLLHKTLKIIRVK